MVYCSRRQGTTTELAELVLHSVYKGSTRSRNVSTDNKSGTPSLTLPATFFARNYVEEGDRCLLRQLVQPEHDFLSFTLHTGVYTVQYM